TGPNNTPDVPSVQYLWTLQNAPLAWLAHDNPDQPWLPEIILEQNTPPPPPAGWSWHKSLLDAEQFEAAFTVDPVRYIPVARNFDQTVSYEYDSDAGDTIRFGDGIFGEVPEQGAVFTVTYRAGGGANGNVAADSITNVDPTDATAMATIKAVTNPFAAAGGADEESGEQVRRLAPQAFRARQFRAVRPEDYEAAAELLPWVLKAGTTYRWTGSWLTVFTTADPRGSQRISPDQQTGLIDLLNRYRLAGYESYAPAPHYISLDLIITVCAQPAAFRGDVEAAILSALSTQKFPNGSTGFFYFDNFTFGSPLVRSALEAAIQNAFGVSGVLSICYRQRGAIPDYISLPATVPIATHAILRVDNDPSRPERGSIKVIVEGGK
ncbi:MAG: baseplate J/gp47 family protein, partial [Deltaproteobacteria bacterium]|nr:baseplate J/gp47 family protein [Deltaproteobacteria bacterium]